MTTKPKTRKAPTPGINPKLIALARHKAAQAAVDPVFAAISEHKALIRESRRLEKSYRVAVDKAEKKYGDRIEHHCRSKNRSAPNDWPGEAITGPFYDRWHRAADAERKAAMRMARTKPMTLAGVGAMIHHAWQASETGRATEIDDWPDWIPTVLKTVSRAAKLGVAA
jgi:hypothetical protein